MQWLHFEPSVKIGSRDQDMINHTSENEEMTFHFVLDHYKVIKDRNVVVSSFSVQFGHHVFRHVIDSWSTRGSDRVEAGDVVVSSRETWLKSRVCRSRCCRCCRNFGDCRNATITVGNF